jgi:hypothetical protein
MHEFDRCIGIELLDSLHQKSLEMKKVYDTQFTQGIHDDQSRGETLF